MKTKYVEPLLKAMSGVLGEGKRVRSSVDMVYSAKEVLQMLFLDKLKVLIDCFFFKKKAALISSHSK